VLSRELGWLDALQRPTRPPRLPTVLTRSEVERLLAQLLGTRWLMASLLYGAGLRVIECLRLRVKDVDFGYRQILVRDGKGEKDRVTMLPETVLEPLRAPLERVRLLHARDLREGYGETRLPYALSRKYPRAGKEWPGSTYFPRRTAPSTQMTESSGDIILTKLCPSAQSRKPHSRRESRST
jgi:integrase